MHAIVTGLTDGGGQGISMLASRPKWKNGGRGQEEHVTSASAVTLLAAVRLIVSSRGNISILERTRRERGGVTFGAAGLAWPGALSYRDRLIVLLPF